MAPIPGSGLQSPLKIWQIYLLNCRQINYCIESLINICYYGHNMETRNVNSVNFSVDPNSEIPSQSSQLPQAKFQDQFSDQQKSTQPSLQKSSNIKIVIILVFIFIVIGAALIVYLTLRKQPSNTTSINMNSLKSATITPKYILPNGYKLVIENEKVNEDENNYYYETRFSNSQDGQIVVMKLKKANFCKEPSGDNLIKGYQLININNNSGCQFTLLDEITHGEKIRVLRWTTNTDGYSMLSYDLGIAFAELLKIATQIK